jgi:RimJ/RimL family protein N-acetyltransferase
MPDEGFTELSGPRVALRRFHPDDLAKFVAYRSSEQVGRFQSWDAPYPRDEGEWTDDLVYALLLDEWQSGSRRIHMV